MVNRRQDRFREDCKAMKPQELWLTQAKSDYRTFKLLGKAGAEPCHQLHYLQMSTEKLLKALLWANNGYAPKPNHKGFRTLLLLFVTGLKRSRQERLSEAMGFNDESQFRAWARNSTAIAGAIERLAPSMAGTGPNAEYPWPHANPTDTPATFSFPIWISLKNTPKGRQLISRVEKAIDCFDLYA